MTQRGYQALKDELKRLKSQERPAAVEAIRLAREHGDLSENAEYDAAKDKQGHIEARISAFEDRLARADVVDISSMPLDRVRFGTRVVLEDVASGEEIVYTLVGEHEADVAQGLLSVTSPVGRALIGKQVDEEVAVAVPAGTRTYEVREIGAME
ncbi:MAG: transcription elongation factor GreA [Deltaproteobacteria bacterium]|nr:transcription elongation factor GreA [Deltaproteobacteria bacterium]MBW2415216.1 transcription elongation factor GreA [Deltaproteobacteria bacterium]